MAYEVKVPRLGWTMEEGVFVEWLKQAGEHVDAGEMLFTIEGEKSIQEIESIDSGILRIPADGPREGDTVAVGAILAYLVESDERAPFESGNSSSESSESEPDERPKDVVAATPSLRRLARKLGVEINRINGSGTAGRVTEEDIRTQTAQTTTVTNQTTQKRATAISPRAARVAVELGLDWSNLEGSGRGGRIREQDIRAAAAVSTELPSADSVSCDNIVPLSTTRKTIAKRMAVSAHTVAAVTLTTVADATNLVALRNQFQSTSNSPQKIVPSYTDFIVKLTAAALSEHPLLNARWEEDRIVLSDGIHIGVAVDTEAGLLVPVIRNVSTLGINEFARRSSELIEKARARRLSTEELEGGTFTVTNLGAFGIDAFTPIINLPECAVLGVGCIRRQPAVVDDDRVVPREMISLSLTFDHRVVDGAPAAQFLAAIRESLEQPGPFLIA